MRVKIVKSDSFRWYRDLIGEEYEVSPTEGAAYDVINSTSPKRAIFKEDCEVIEEENEVSALKNAPFALPADYVYVENFFVITPDGKKYRLVPEDESSVVPAPKETELKTFADCWNKVEPSWFIGSTNMIENLDPSAMGAAVTSCSHNQLPNKKSAKQIQAAIKLFVIHAALNEGEYKFGDKDGWMVFFEYQLCAKPRFIYGNGVCLANPYVFKDEHSARKAIEIGKDLWLEYFGIE